MRLGSTNICLQRALRDDRDPRLGSLPHTKIPDSVENQKRSDLSALGVAGSRPPCGRPRLPVARARGEGSPCCHAAPVHVRPHGLGPRGQPPMGYTSGAAAAPAPKLRQARAMPSPLPPPAANPLHMPSPSSPLPHLTWPLSAGPQRPRNPWPGRADLAPGPRPGVAAWRPLPRGGLAARRPPPCVAPTSPCRPQPSPLAPTGPCARLSAHRAAPYPSPCGDSRRSLLPPSPTPA